MCINYVNWQVIRDSLIGQITHGRWGIPPGKIFRKVSILPNWMPVHQLGQSTGYKWFIDWSNSTWQMGNPTWGKPPKRCQLCTAYRVYSWPCHLLCKVGKSRQSLSFPRYSELSRITLLLISKILSDFLYSCYDEKL